MDSLVPFVQFVEHHRVNIQPYRLFLVGLVMVIVFSGCFFWLGQRGYGESWRLDTLSYARAVTGGGQVVTECKSRNKAAETDKGADDRIA